MAKDRWTDGVDGAFSDATKWSTGSAPGDGDDAVLNATGTYTVIASGAIQVNSIQTAAGATLNLQSSQFEATAGTGSGANAGAIEVTDGSTLTIGGTMKNSGKIDVGAVSHATSLLLAADTTLSGGGFINFTTGSNSLNLIAAKGAAAVTLTNVDNHILGAGKLMGLTFVNDAGGWVNGNNATGALLLQSDTITNDGTIQATAVGGVGVIDSTVTNDGGTLKAVGSGKLTILNSTVNGGLVSTAAGTDTITPTLNFVTATLVGCNLQIQHGGKLTIGLGAHSSISGGSFTNAGQVVIGDGGVLSLGEDVSVGGKIDIDAGSHGASLIIVDAVTIAGADVTLNSIGSTITGAKAASKLTLDGVVHGVGTISALTLITNNLINANGNGAILIAPGAGHGVINNGALDGQGAGTLVISGTTLTNAKYLQALDGGKVDLDHTTVFRAASSSVSTTGRGSRLMLNSSRINGAGTLTIDVGGVLSADSGANAIGLDGFVNEGTVVIAQAVSLSLKGDVTNKGRITLNGAFTGATLLTVAGGLTLSGGGSVLLSQSSANTIGAVGTKFGLTNVDNTISGNGVINAPLVNQASGLVRVSSGALQIVGAVTNAGHINAIQSGIISLSGATTNRGTLQALGTALLSITDTTVANLGGTILAGNGARVSLDGSHILSGSISVVKGGTLSIVSESSIVRSDISNAGTIAINQELILTADVTNTGVININGGGLSLNGPVTLSGGGHVSMQGIAPVISSVGDTRRTLTNVDNTISGFGLLGNGLLTLINQSEGVIDANATSRLTLQMGASTLEFGSLTNAGRIEATGAGGLTIQDTIVKNAGGSIAAIGAGSLRLDTVQSSGGVISSQSGALLSLESTTLTGGTVSTLAGGKLTADEGRSVITGATFANAGETDIGNTATLVADGTLNNSGLVVLQVGATLGVGAGGLSLTGDGQVTLGAQGGNRIRADTPGAVLRNLNNTISGTGEIGGNGLVLHNAGVIDGAGLVIDTDDKVILNSGTIEETAAGQTTVIDSAVQNTGKLIVTAGTLVVNEGVTGAGSVQIDGGEAIFSSTISENVAFTAGVGRLELDAALAYTGAISGFSKTGGTSLDLGNIAFVSADEATFSKGVLTVSDGNFTARIKLVGDFSNTTFIASSDGDGGTLIVAQAAAPHAAVASFVAAAAAFDAGAPAEHLAVEPWQAGGGGGAVLHLARSA